MHIFEHAPMRTPVILALGLAACGGPSDPVYLRPVPAAISFDPGGEATDTPSTFVLPVRLEDMLGLSPRVPRFVRRYGALAEGIEKAIADYAGDVRSRSFPGPEHVYGMKGRKA